MAESKLLVKLNFENNSYSARGPTLDFAQHNLEFFEILAWFQDSWHDSRDSCLPNKEKIYYTISSTQKLQHKK